MSENHYPQKLTAAIRTIEDELSNYYGLTLENGACEFLIDKVGLGSFAPEISDEVSKSRGSIVSVEGAEEVFLGVFFSDQIIEGISQTNCLKQLSHENLDAFCVLIEEVSHFHLLMSRMSARRTVSQIELEWQGEVDKFLVASSLLQKQTDDPHFSQLFGILFDRSQIIADANAERYYEASQFAGRFWRQILNRFHSPLHDNIRALKQILQETYKSSWQDKVAFLEQNRIAA